MKLLLTLLTTLPLAAQDEVRGTPRVLDDDGAWCWFQGERAIITDGTLVVGTVSAGVRDATRRGDINVLVHDLSRRTTRIDELHDQLERDDHDSPAIVSLSEGRLLAMYSRHGTDSTIRTRVGSGGKWSDERALEVDAERFGVTYSNVFRLASGRLLDFFRGAGWNPHVITSEDDGATWGAPAMLVDGPGRPYVCYAARGDSVHFVSTEQHPRNFDNGLFHGVLSDGVVAASDGTRLRVLAEGPVPVEKLTRVFQGTPDAVAWCSDIRVASNGQPVIVFSVQIDGRELPRQQGGLDHRYRYARFDGEAWKDHAIGFAGRRLYAGEDDYTGLVVLDPNDVNTVVLSTDAHPVTGAALISSADDQRHYELFRGRTHDGGRSWSFVSLTRNSTVDNVRPVYATGATGAAQLVWLRGRYRTYTDFDLAVFALGLEDELPDLAPL